MQVHVEECRGLRRASASVRDGGVIFVKVPRHWPKAIKSEVIVELVERIEKKDAREKRLLEKAGARQARVTILTQPELEAYVRQINAETFNVPLGKIRLGHSRYNHLAQVNLQTRTMTVSRYCLKNAPAEALRYLIVHELAHYFVSGHGPDFWALVARHVPDYRLQSRIMKAFHHQAVIEDARQKQAGNEAGIAREQPLELPAAPRREARGKTRPLVPVIAPTPKIRERGGIPGLFRQLLLWGD